MGLTALDLRGTDLAIATAPLKGQQDGKKQYLCIILLTLFG